MPTPPCAKIHTQTTFPLLPRPQESSPCLFNLQYAANLLPFLIHHHSPGPVSQARQSDLRTTPARPPFWPFFLSLSPSHSSTISHRTMCKYYAHNHSCGHVRIVFAAYCRQAALIQRTCRKGHVCADVEVEKACSACHRPPAVASRRVSECRAGDGKGSSSSASASASSSSSSSSLHPSSSSSLSSRNVWDQGWGTRGPEKRRETGV